MKTILLIIVASFLPIVTNSQEKTDELFINWNKETVSSLKSIKETLTEQNYAKNRLEARFAYWEIKDESQLNRNSIRYTFLKILNKKIDSKDLVIIEADNSGEYYRIQNFVVYLNANNKLDLDIYRYDRNEGWKLEKIITNYDGKINSILENKGKYFINRDDIIVSHFELGKIVSSEYFLFETLKNNEVKKIISIEQNK
ncbi:hypothetical protein ACM55H_05910 [Flavobacterium sp. ZT3R17]|uniref:hypothetical protein n=1 Tax=Flavobacterium cryoconiti TaxID=3398736 RepID=UPI003A853E06